MICGGITSVWSLYAGKHQESDDIEKLLSEKKPLGDPRRALVNHLLKRREVAIKSFDERLANLGYRANSAAKRGHHKKPPAKFASAQVPLANSLTLDSNTSCEHTFRSVRHTGTQNDS